MGKYIKLKGEDKAIELGVNGVLFKRLADDGITNRISIGGHGKDYYLVFRGEPRNIADLIEMLAGVLAKPEIIDQLRELEIDELLLETKRWSD